jgi:hypothetical protein
VWGEAAGLSLTDRVRNGAAPATALLGRGAEQVLPVQSSLAALFPWGGLRRGSTVAVEGSASLLFALLAEASQAGSWCAVVGLPSLGAVAAAEAGVATERLALVPYPGTDTAGVAAALVDGMDVVVVGGTARLSATDGRRLAARARQRGAVLVPFGSWQGADVELSCTGGRWYGLGTGHGHLRSREVTVRAQGRGAASRPRTARMLLPAAAGELAPVPAVPLGRVGAQGVGAQVVEAQVVGAQGGARVAAAVPVQRGAPRQPPRGLPGERSRDDRPGGQSPPIPKAG